MKLITDLQVQDFNYTLPEDRIARFPLEDRDSSKLLHYENGVISNHQFNELPNFLNSTDLLVLNNTKVIRARLIFTKETNAEIEIFCLKPLMPSTFDEALTCAYYCIWECTVGNLKKWKNERLQIQFTYDGKPETLTAIKVQRDCFGVAVRFEWTGTAVFSQVLEQCGNIPIPPYLKRDSEEIDADRYQTVFSKFHGSVAAPTAGLHFSKSLVERLRNKTISLAEITLHVGAGTFLPMKGETVGEHVMHSEYFRIDKRTLDQLIGKLGHIIAVGTTSLRMLESLYWLGVRIGAGQSWKEITQWEAYETVSDMSAETALKNVRKAMERTQSEYCYASTQIMIVPGYKFRTVKGLITNFHQPQSTLLLLIAAILGDDWKRVYQHAMDNNYRFLSYGDGSLLMIN